jgi:hypothetical protein
MPAPFFPVAVFSFAAGGVLGVVLAAFRPDEQAQLPTRSPKAAKIIIKEICRLLFMIDLNPFLYHQGGFPSNAFPVPKPPIGFFFSSGDTAFW